MTSRAQERLCSFSPSEVAHEIETRRTFGLTLVPLCSLNPKPYYVNLSTRAFRNSRQHGLNPIELDRPPGILGGGNLPLNSILPSFVHSEQETTMAKTTIYPLVPGPPPRGILCKSMTTTFKSTTSMLKGTWKRGHRCRH